MRTAIISDVHGNIEALDAVLLDIDRRGIERIFCLGDTVGYGADPNACCERVRARATFTVLGNHDAAVIGAMDEGYYYEAARKAVGWTRDHLSEDNYRWLYGLPYTRAIDGAAFFHAAPLMPSAFFYVVQSSEAQAHTQAFSHMKPYNFVGHAHLTMCFALTDKKARMVEAGNIRPAPDTCYLINVGSVGQPRDRNPKACYVQWDAEAGTVEHVRVPYDIKAAADKIRAAGLDAKFSRRLETGN